MNVGWPEHVNVSEIELGSPHIERRVMLSGAGFVIPHRVWTRSISGPFQSRPILSLFHPALLFTLVGRYQYSSAIVFESVVDSGVRQTPSMVVYARPCTVAGSFELVGGVFGKLFEEARREASSGGFVGNFVGRLRRERRQDVEVAAIRANKPEAWSLAA